VQPGGERGIECRDHGPQAGQSLGQILGAGVPGRAGPRGKGDLVDGRP
jgi:hypothetical protein